MKAPVSLCIIVRDEPLLEDCLKSIKDYVSEIVIVDTGSTDGVTQEVAKKYADIFEVYTGCNEPETGLIEDFSLARQRSFDLATQPWILWCDADDVIVGGEKLYELTQMFQPGPGRVDSVAYLFCYEYAYNAQNQCVLTHFRERLVFNKKKYHWLNPVHEVLVPNNDANVALMPRPELVFKHKRQYSNKKQEPGRNLRILKKYYEKIGDSDARQLYYLGLEYSNCGMLEEAIKHLTKYIDVSGWEDERVMACLKLTEIYLGLAQYEEVVKWGFKAIEIKENWAEGYFALARAFYFLALNGGPNEFRNWQKCAYFAKAGLRLPPTQTLLFINPLERSVEIHLYLNVALNKLGDVAGALESANAALQFQPEQPQLTSNKKLYEIFLARQDAVHATTKLRDLGEIAEKQFADIVALLNKQLISEWLIPTTWDFDSLPLNLEDEQLQASIIMLWKQYLLYNDVQGAITFLENAPQKIKDSRATKTALTLTQRLLDNNKKLMENSLDIVFYAGDGVETWNPDTVKKTGIGGSELMLLEQAKRLAALGHNVRVYNSCGKDEGLYDNVYYYQTNKFKDLECDVLIVSRRADALADEFNIQARLKLLWVHDVFAINATNELLLKADRILALTEWHKQNLINTHHIHPDHIIVTRNGIDLSRFENKVDRNPLKCVNSSSPDRSWPVLLEVWPKIKERVPKAELHLYYGFKNWLFSAQNYYPEQLPLINSLQEKIKQLEPLGVVYHDRVSQEELAKEYLSAGVWTHPTWFTETSCITAMEAQAAGLRMVTSAIAALNETAGDRAVLLEGGWETPEYQQKFIDSVVKALVNTDNSDRVRNQEYAKANFSLDDLAKQWEEMFFKLLNEFKTNPIIPYQPTKAYLPGGING